MSKITRRKFSIGAAAVAGGIGAAGVAFFSTRKKPSDIRIEHISHSFEEHAFRAPFRFAQAVVNRQTMLTAQCTVQTAAGKVATGFGILPLNYTFSFPSQRLSAHDRLEAMKALADEIAKITGAYQESGHPIGPIRRIGGDAPMTSCWPLVLLGFSCLGFSVTLVHAAQVDVATARHAPSAPTAEINNGVLKAQLYLPDARKGFYRGTRFDWSGVIGSLEYKGHRYYGPWFTKTDPTVNDFIYQGADIIAGPCSAITGPAEEFSTDDKALGYDEAKPGGTFIKIGVGVLRKPREGGSYNRFRLYEIVDPGTWKVETTRNRIEFTQDLADPSSGYAYTYQKTIELAQGLPDMVMGHKLKNTGKRRLASSVYNHNFLVLDGQPPGPDFVLKMPFQIKTKRAPDSALAEARGNELVYRKALADKETVFTQLQGFGSTAADYRFTIENKKTGAGLKITGDRPLSDLVLWSIRSVLSLEPFIAMTIEPGQEFTWKYTYTYYVTGGKDK